MENKYNVIWIDDQWKDQTTFIDVANIAYSIAITPFTTQKEGMEELEKNIDKWDAIILDAKGYDESENEQTTTTGLSNAIKKIHELRSKKFIPYFILTGQTDLMDNDVFRDSYGQFYQKGTNDGSKLLFEDLKKQVSKNTRFQMKEQYSEAIKALTYFSVDASSVVLDVLEAIHFPSEHPDFTPELYFNQFRKIVETIFRKCNEFGIIPDKCINDETNSGVNINQSMHYLIGNPCNGLNIRYGQKDERVVPKHIQEIMSMIINIGNIESHSSESLEDEKKTINIFHKEVASARYVVYQLTFGLCEFAMWMKEYIESHTDKEHNKSKCCSLETEPSALVDDDKIGVVEKIDNNEKFYHIGDKYVVLVTMVDKLNSFGKKVRVTMEVENGDSRTKSIYPQFAQRIKPLE